MRNKRFIATLAVVSAAALVPAAGAQAGQPTPTAPAPVHVERDRSQLVQVPQSEGGEQQASMFGGVSILLSLFACTGATDDPPHAGDTGTKDDEATTEDNGGACEQGGSGAGGSSGGDGGGSNAGGSAG